MKRFGQMLEFLIGLCVLSILAVIVLSLWQFHGTIALVAIWILGACAIQVPLFLLAYGIRFVMKPRYRDIGQYGTLVDQFGSVRPILPQGGFPSNIPQIAQTSTRNVQVQPSVPTLAEVLSSGLLDADGLLLGFNEQFQPVFEEFGRNMMMLVGGETQSGKSNTIYLLTLQHILKEHKVTLCDPHRTKMRSVSTLLGPLVEYVRLASEIEQISRAVQDFHDELLRRQSGGSCFPYVLIFDEWTKYAKTAFGKMLSKDIESFAQEGSGYNMSVILGGQLWKATRSGGTELRRSFVSSLCHRLDENESRHILGNIPRYAKMTASLITGHALYYAEGTIQSLSIPFGEPNDSVTVMTGMAEKRR